MIIPDDLETSCQRYSRGAEGVDPSPEHPLRRPAHSALIQPAFFLLSEPNKQSPSRTPAGCTSLDLGQDMHGSLCDVWAMRPDHPVTHSCNGGNFRGCHERLSEFRLIMGTLGERIAISQGDAVRRLPPHHPDRRVKSSSPRNTGAVAPIERCRSNQPGDIPSSAIVFRTRTQHTPATECCVAPPRLSPAWIASLGLVSTKPPADER